MCPPSPTPTSRLLLTQRIRPEATETVPNTTMGKGHRDPQPTHSITPPNKPIIYACGSGNPPKRRPRRGRRMGVFGDICQERAAHFGDDADIASCAGMAGGQ